MKKICLVAVAIFMTLLVSGCGKQQKLSCVQKTEMVSVKFNVGLNGKIIKDMDFHYDLDLSQYNDEQIAAIEKQDFCATVKDSMSQYKEAFKKCEHKVVNKSLAASAFGKKGKNLTVSAELDVDKIAKNTLEKMTSVETAKSELEAQGYKCTIK